MEHHPAESEEAEAEEEENEAEENDEEQEAEGEQAEEEGDEEGEEEAEEEAEEDAEEEQEEEESAEKYASARDEQLLRSGQQESVYKSAYGSRPPSTTKRQKWSEKLKSPSRAIGSFGFATAYNDEEEDEKQQ